MEASRCPFQGLGPRRLGHRSSVRCQAHYGYQFPGQRQQEQGHDGLALHRQHLSARFFGSRKRPAGHGNHGPGHSDRDIYRCRNHGNEPVARKGHEILEQGRQFHQLARKCRRQVQEVRIRRKGHPDSCRKRFQEHPLAD